MVGIAATFLVLSLLSFLISYFVRASIFRGMKDASIAGPIIRGTRVYAFADALFIELFIVRKKLSDADRKLVNKFVVSTLCGWLFLALFAGFVIMAGR